MSDPRTSPRPAVTDLRGYSDEAHGGLNLSNNANLFGPNPALAKALATTRPEDLWDYPSLTSERLREALGAKLGIDAAQVLVGNGSNDLIDVAIRTFAGPEDAVAYHPPTFAMIPIFTRANGVEARPVPLGPGFSLEPGLLAGAGARVTFVVTPNNPTGNAFRKADVLRVVRDASGIVVVDEAYAEFAGSSVVSEIAAHPNLIVLRTFSKAHGLAGLRVGYLAGDRAAVASLAKVRGPFRLNAVSETAALLALRETRWLEATVDALRTERARLADALVARGFVVHPSDANFLLAEPPPPLDGTTLAKRLAARDVWVRDFGGDLARYVRITVGPRPLMDAFLQHLDACRKEAGA